MITKLDPISKLCLYDNKEMQPRFSIEEEKSLREIEQKIWDESSKKVVYEGRFGASPREIRVVLHRASQNIKYKTLTPMCVLSELKKLTQERTVYEFLQIEPAASIMMLTTYSRAIRRAVGRHL